MSIAHCATPKAFPHRAFLAVRVLSSLLLQIQLRVPACKGCHGMWCFVDPSDCTRPTQPSRHFPDATWGGSPLTYSYETCGFKDDSVAGLVRAIKLHAAAQPNEKIRIAFPNNNHIFFNNDPAFVPPGTGVGGTDVLGAVPVFVDALFRRYEIPWEEVAVSDASKEASPSSGYTACAHEVGIGGVLPALDPRTGLWAAVLPAHS